MERIINNLPKLLPLQDQIGRLSNLTTDIKSSLVNAVNWLYDYVNNKFGTDDISSIGDGTVTGAISSLHSDIETVNNNLSALYNHNERVAISQFPYTAPSKGLARLTLFKNNSTTSWNAIVYVNGSITGYFIGTTLPYHSQTFELRVRKGDVINYMVESGGETYIGTYSEFVAD